LPSDFCVNNRRQLRECSVRQPPDETASGTAALPAALVAELSFAPTAAAVADAEQAAGVRKRSYSGPSPGPDTAGLVQH
jgi:hypothetical protein